ncbi:hypothetical protein BWQ96_07475 [Gracilariopsis chorda]|uniref:Uncharacterized protein n=1 Tax=Gracilariopsis chorda TaxID=448386 RepID=A0A2V3IL33_9FLOR|nr:hypothetical protein BWQ96_07475 [Gracilariopsis chorda]|eukprot:PXF42768.1 hypothetical protein BWQ96_07475 [Gracilariopsis chorda]
METVSHELKAFALLQTSADHHALRNPFNIARLLAEAGIRQRLALVKTPDLSKFLIRAPKSAVPLIAPAYKRFYQTALRHCGVLRLPEVNVTAVTDILDLLPESSATAELVNFTFKLRDEIKRLEYPNTTWRPRYYFAESLREHEKSCFEALKHSNPSCDLSPMPPKEPRAQTRNNDDDETRPARILCRRVNPSPEPIINPQETNVEEHATPFNQSNGFHTATVPSSVTPQPITQSSNNAVPMDVAGPSDVQNSSFKERKPALQTTTKMPVPPTVGDCPPITTILNLLVPTVEFLLRSLRLPYIELYYHILNNYNTARSEALKLHTLARIFATPKLVLCKNGRGEPRNRNSLPLHRSIKHRISMAKAGK